MSLRSENVTPNSRVAQSNAAAIMADIVRATYYITNAADADAVFAVCGENLGDVRPAATLLTVAGLYKPEMKIEIEVTAKRRTA